MAWQLKTQWCQLFCSNISLIWKWNTKFTKKNKKNYRLFCLLLPFSQQNRRLILLNTKTRTISYFLFLVWRKITYIKKIFPTSSLWICDLWSNSKPLSLDSLSLSLSATWEARSDFLGQMKCFHFTNGERRDDEEPGIVCRAASKVSWARSLSVASSSYDTTRRSEFDLDSRDLSDSVAFQELLSLRRANDLRVFKFSELKSASRGFSRALLIGEGGFGCVYRGIVKGSDDDATKMDVAIKQLNRNGFQA